MNVFNNQAIAEDLAAGRPGESLALQQLQALQQVVDEGRAVTDVTPSLERVLVQDKIVAFDGTGRIGLAPYINWAKKPREAAIIRNFNSGLVNEHAIYLSYEVEGSGCIAYLRGLRHQTEQFFFAPDSEEASGADLLASFLIRSVLHWSDEGRLIFRGAPILVPDVGIDDYRTMISYACAFLERNVDKNDGAIVWDGPNFHKIYGLARPGWMAERE